MFFLSEITAFTTAILFSIIIIWRLKSFNGKNFKASVMMSTVVCFAFGIIIILRNGCNQNIVIQCTNILKQNFYLTSTLGEIIYKWFYVKEISYAMFQEKYIFDAKIYNQPISCFFVLYFSFCTILIIKNNPPSSLYEMIKMYISPVSFYYSVIIYFLQIYIFEYINNYFQYSYVIFFLLCVCLSLAGIFSFWGIFSTFISIFAFLTILFSGIPPFSPLAKLWEQIFEIMKIKGSIIQLLILFLSAISSSWDTLVNLAMGDTPLYKKMTDFFVNLTSSKSTNA